MQPLGQRGHYACIKTRVLGALFSVRHAARGQPELPCLLLFLTNVGAIITFWAVLIFSTSLHFPVNYISLLTQSMHAWEGLGKSLIKSTISGAVHSIPGCLLNAGTYMARIDGGHSPLALSSSARVLKNRYGKLWGRVLCGPAPKPPTALNPLKCIWR